MKFLYFLVLVAALAVSLVLAAPVAKYGDQHGEQSNAPRQDPNLGLTTVAPGSPWDNNNPEQVYTNAIHQLVGALYPIITGLAEMSTLINLTNRDRILQQTIRETIQPVLNLLDDNTANQSLVSRTTEALCRRHPCPVKARAVWNSTLELCECAEIPNHPLELEPSALSTRSAMAHCRPHPCPGLNVRAVWNPTLQLCDCAPLQIRPLKPEAPILDTRSVVTSCRHLRCPLGAQAFWDPMGKTCICPTLPKMPIPHHPATVSKNLPTTETKSAEIQLDTRDPDAACPPLVCPLGARALWNRAQKKCNCPPTPKLIADDTSDSADLSESTDHPIPTSADIPSITTEPSTSTDDLSQFIKRGDLVEKTASSLTLPTHAPRAENPLDYTAHLADRGIQVLKPAKTFTPAKINPNPYPPPKLARRDTTATAANPIWTPEGLSEQFLKDVAAFQAASFEDKAKLGPKFVFKTLNRVDHGFPPTATSTGKVDV